jgi:hypothetical protein
MGWTKRQLLSQAYEEIGLANYVFDIQPEQEMSALRRLDAMVQSWEQEGVRLGYAASSTSDGSDLDQDSGIPDTANEAVYTNLAIRLASSVGKVPSVELKVIAKAGKDSLLARAAYPRQRRLGQMAAGAGYKTPWNQVFINTPSDSPLRQSGDGTLEI